MRNNGKVAVKSARNQSGARLPVDWKRLYQERPDIKRVHDILRRAEDRSGVKISLSDIAISLKET